MIVEDLLKFDSKEKIKLNRFKESGFDFTIEHQRNTLTKAVNKEHSRIIVGCKNVINSFKIFAKIYKRLLKNNYECCLIHGVEFRFADYENEIRNLKKYDYVFITCVSTDMYELYNVKKLLRETNIGLVISYLTTISRFQGFIDELNPHFYANNFLYYSKSDCYLYQKVKRRPI